MEAKQESRRKRVKDGIAAQRIFVGLSPEMLERVKSDAQKENRTLSNMCQTIISKHYQAA